MKMRTAWKVVMLVAGAAASAVGGSAQAQMPGMAPGPYGPMAGPGMPSPYAPPTYAVAPVGYMNPDMMVQPAPMPADAGYDYEGAMADGGACGPGGCGPFSGCGPFGGCGPRLPGLLRYLLPYDDGGCCAPHWFDVHAEYVNLRRDRVSDTVNFSSLGPLIPPQIVLSTDDLDISQGESGFRTTVTMQVGVGSNLELSYLGGFNYSSQASVTSAGGFLYSAFSNFGQNPAPPNGFIETEDASFHGIAYSSDFDNLELNFRQRWQGYGCKLQGSWLVGIRYFQLDEDFAFNTVSTVNNGSMQYLVGTSNQLTGVQIGGDIWACLIPGWSVGTEGKVGIYGNRAQQDTNITATTIIGGLNEEVADDDVAFVGELGIMTTYRLNQSWTFRGGYNVLYIAGVALAPENVNFNPPFLVPPFVNPPRNPFIDSNGDVLYHGFTAGFEYMW